MSQNTHFSKYLDNLFKIILQSHIALAGEMWCGKRLVNEVKKRFITAVDMGYITAESLWCLDSTARFCDRRVSDLISSMNEPDTGGDGGWWGKCAKEQHEWTQGRDTIMFKKTAARRTVKLHYRIDMLSWCERLISIDIIKNWLWWQAIISRYVWLE